MPRRSRRPGARGVMQVMPATGEWIAQNIRLPGFDRAKLFESDTAINLGTWYISHLMKRFKERPAPCVPRRIMPVPRRSPDG